MLMQKGEDCGRPINQAPESGQTKLPLLFLQQRPQNYGFHTHGEGRKKAMCLTLPLLLLLLPELGADEGN